MIIDRHLKSLTPPLHGLVLRNRRISFERARARLQRAMDDAETMVMLANELKVRAAEASESLRASTALLDEVLAVLQEQTAAEAIEEAARIPKKH